jgi:hypothetical protein
VGQVIQPMPVADLSRGMSSVRRESMYGLNGNFFKTFVVFFIWLSIRFRGLGWAWA